MVRSPAGNSRSAILAVFVSAAMASCATQMVTVPPADQQGDKVAIFKISPVVNASVQGDLYRVVDLNTGQNVVPPGSLGGNRVVWEA